MFMMMRRPEGKYVVQYSAVVLNLENDEWDNLNPLLWWAGSIIQYFRLLQLGDKIPGFTSHFCAFRAGLQCCW